MKQGGQTLQPRMISKFWLRRLCEVSFLSCLIIFILYFWARFIPTGYQLPIGLLITDLAAACAAIGSITSLILCFWLPKNHHSQIAVAVYLLTLLVVIVTVYTSGHLRSPFASLWIAITIFAGFFGFMMIGLIAGLVIISVIFTTLQGQATFQSTLEYLLFGLLPLLLSFVLWNRHQPKKESNSYIDLKNKLSSVEGKSDVVINTIDDGVLAINREGVIELINPSAQTMIGWNQGDALGLSWNSVLKLVNAEGRSVEELENPIAQALSTNKPTHSDKLFLLTSSERRRLVSIVSSPVGTDGEGIIVVFRDITKEKAEEREQAEFISTASHEMRTPVASIEGYLGLALNPATAQIDEKARDFITKAHASAQHLGRLFQDLLDISRAEDGRLKNDPKIINVGEFTHEIFDGLSQKAASKNLNYIYRPDVIADSTSERAIQPIFYANVDPDHLREIVSNLIENAIKYTPEGEVIIDVTGDNEQISISVKDSGIGIPAEDLPHLFQKFYRVDNSDTREIGGTGLGLYLARRLAENMSGNLRVESEYKKGSTFFLEIPRMSNDEAQRKLDEAKTKLDSNQAKVASDLEQQMQAMAMPEDIAKANQSAEPQVPPTPPTATNQPPAAPMQTLPPTPTTAMPSAPPKPANSPNAAPTLADIENQLDHERKQLSIPDRK